MQPFNVYRRAAMNGSPADPLGGSRGNSWLCSHSVTPAIASTINNIVYILFTQLPALVNNIINIIILVTLDYNSYSRVLHLQLLLIMRLHLTHDLLLTSFCFCLPSNETPSAKRHPHYTDWLTDSTDWAWHLFSNPSLNLAPSQHTVSAINVLSFHNSHNQNSTLYK